MPDLETLAAASRLCRFFPRVRMCVEGDVAAATTHLLFSHIGSTGVCDSFPQVNLSISGSIRKEFDFVAMQSRFCSRCSLRSLH